MTIDQLVDAIKKHGSKNNDGKFVIAYGVLYDKTQNTRMFWYNNLNSPTKTTISRGTEWNVTIRQEEKTGGTWLI